MGPIVGFVQSLHAEASRYKVEGVDISVDGDIAARFRNTLPAQVGNIALLVLMALYLLSLFYCISIWQTPAHIQFTFRR